MTDFEQVGMAPRLYEPAPSYVRNLGFFCLDEQERLGNAIIAIGGGGGDGGEIARLLVRTGIGCGPQGEIRLADPEVFEIENINRQTACTRETLGRNKAEAVGELLKRINPDINLRVYNEGVTQENVVDFVQGATLVVDETAYERHELAVMLGRACAPRGIPITMGMNIGFGGIVTTMHPDGIPFEKQLGFKPNQSIEEIAAQHVPVSRWAPYLPYKYGDFRVLSEVAEGRKPAPSVASGLEVTASITTNQIMWNILAGRNHRPMPTYFRRVKVVDPVAGIDKTIRWNELNHKKYGALTWIRNHTVGYPSTDYITQ